MEAFIDEMAAAAGQDPLSFRLKYLADQRAIDVLRAAAQAYGWENRPSPAPRQEGKLARGRGIAWVNRDDVRVATIADVTVDRESGAISVKRVVVAHDCGLVVNPDGCTTRSRATSSSRPAAPCTRRWPSTKRM